MAATGVHVDRGARHGEVRSRHSGGVKRTVMGWPMDVARGESGFRRRLSLWSARTGPEPASDDGYAVALLVSTGAARCRPWTGASSYSFILKALRLQGADPVRGGPRRQRARNPSRSRAHRPTPRPETFSGLRSRWMTPREWAWPTISQTRASCSSAGATARSGVGISAHLQEDVSQGGSRKEVSRENGRPSEAQNDVVN